MAKQQTPRFFGRKHANVDADDGATDMDQQDPHLYYHLGKRLQQVFEVWNNQVRWKLGVVTLTVIMLLII